LGIDVFPVALDLLCGSQSWLQAAFQAASSPLAISWGRLQSAEGFSPNFFGFAFGRCAVQKTREIRRTSKTAGWKARLQARLPATHDFWTS
jgi:hypothetical protein